MDRALDYLRTHWRGEQSLLWSFWVNLVALRIAILFFERFTHPPFTEQSGAAMIATAAYFALFQLLVYPWQVIGLVRACDRYLAALGSISTVLLAHAGIVASLFFTVIYVLGAFQALFGDASAMLVNQRLKSPPLLAEYSLTLSDDGSRIHLQGDFRVGVTKEMRSLVERNPGVGAIVLSSNGGRVTEGRGVARLIKQHGLDTYVFDLCKSACTTAFIAGAKRTLGVNGKLGFHQFAMNSKLKTPYIDPEEEQKIDLEFYTGQKIDKAFLEKVFQASHSDIWFPDPEELVAAGVVHFVER